MRYKLVLLLLVAVAFLAAEDLLLDIMFTNDMHGGIDRYSATFMNPNFPPMLGGGGSAATYIKDVRKKTNGTTRDNLLVDAGDFFQGHPVGTVTKGKSVISYFNMIGYDLTVVGNHEYDIGEEELIETYKDAEFPILSCNIVKRGTEELVDYVTPYIIVEKMGVKIGIIGLTTTDTEKMSFPENIANITITPAKEAVEKYIPIVKEKGADVVIVVGHMGLPYNPEPAYKSRYLKDETDEDYEPQDVRYWGFDAQEIAHEVGGIDLFFGGHMHKGFKEPWIDPNTHTMVFQGYAYGSNVGHVTIKIDKETKTVSGYLAPAIREGVLVTVFEDEFPADEVIGDSILVMQKLAEKGMDEVIGVASVYISKDGNDAQNAIGNLVCEAMLEATDADFSFINLGGVRDEFKKGPITYRDAFNVMPFDNQVVSFTVDGRFMKDIIEMRVSGTRHGLRVAGVKIVYSRDREDYDRVTELLIDGQKWDPDKIYKVTTTDFLLQGNAGLTMLTKIPEEQIQRYEMDLRDAITDFVKANTPVSNRIDSRWKRDDKSEPAAYLKK